MYIYMSARCKCHLYIFTVSTYTHIIVTYVYNFPKCFSVYVENDIYKLKLCFWKDVCTVCLIGHEFNWPIINCFGGFIKLQNNYK